jgi:YceI-like protein
MNLRLLASVVTLPWLLAAASCSSQTNESAEKTASTPAVPAAPSPDEPLLAVITHKAGAAARMAHDHLVVARDARVETSFSSKKAEAARISVEFPVASLAVDDPKLQKLWYPRIHELGVLEEPFKEASEGDRAKIRASMLSDEQLDAAHHAAVSGKVVSVREERASIGAVAFTHVAKVALTIRGRTVERDFPARWEERDGAPVLEALGTLRFTEFGIEPYSAFLGAVRNQDEFHVYVRLPVRE